MKSLHGHPNMFTVSIFLKGRARVEKIMFTVEGLGSDPSQTKRVGFFRFAAARSPSFSFSSVDPARGGFKFCCLGIFGMHGGGIEHQGLVSTTEKRWRNRCERFRTCKTRPIADFLVK